jgi:hypothetical protein
MGLFLLFPISLFSFYDLREAWNLNMSLSLSLSLSLTSSTFGAAGTSAVGMERVLRHRRARPSATRGQLQIFEVIVVAVRIWPEAVSEP